MKRLESVFHKYRCWSHGAHKSHPTDPSSHAETDVGINIHCKFYLYGKSESTFNPEQQPHKFGQLWSSGCITRNWYNGVTASEVCGCIYLFIYNNVLLYETAIEGNKI